MEGDKKKTLDAEFSI